MSSPGWGLSGWGDPLKPIPVGPFDQLLTGVGTILRHAGSNRNKYGIPDQTFVVVEDNVSLRISTHGEGIETVDPKQIARRRFEIFMRPRAYDLGETHWIESENRLFNIRSVEQVRDRTHAINHLQVFVDEVMPSHFILETSS